MDLKTTKGVKTLGIIGLLLIIIAGFMLVVQPLMAQSAKYSSEMNAKEQEKTTVSKELASLQHKKDTIGLVEELDKSTDKNFPAWADTPNMVSDIKSLANQSGLSSSSITNITSGVPTLVTSATGTGADGSAPAPDAAAPEAASDTGTPAAAAPNSASNTSNLAEITLTIDVEGKTKDLLTFTNKLKDLDRSFVVDSYVLTNNVEENAASVTIAAKTYIYKEIPTISDVEEAPAVEESEKSAPVPAP